MPRWAIEALSSGDAPSAGAMLGRAFSENPIARACLRACDREARLARVTRLNRGLLEAARRAGRVEVVRDRSEAEGAGVDGARVVGAQLSFAPGQWPLGLATYPFMALGALGTGARGALRYAWYDHHVHPLHPRAPHFYLFVLGVDPALQGRGVGSALLRAFCGRADDAGTLAYLETDRRESVLLYQRHGFEVAAEVDVPGLGLHAWTMKRNPR